MKAEIERRAGIAVQLTAYFHARPYQWITAVELGHRFGQAFRSRLVEARKQIEKDGGSIPWNQQQGGASAYMFRPYKPIGRDAGIVGTQASLF